jgi:serine protease inhibitor
VTDLGFALAMHRATAPDTTKNACWSPYSVASALGLVAVGARGTTRDELAVLLCGEKSADLTDLGRLLTKAARLEGTEYDDKPVLAVSNALWVDGSIEIREAFAEELARWCDGNVRPAPFRTAPEEARELINREVAETTRDLIPELVPSGAIRPTTVAALVNALYLKCGWHSRFTDGATKPRPFHTPKGTVEVPTMEQTESLGYAATGGWQVVSLAAVGGVQAVILMPDGDLADAEQKLDVPRLNRLLEAPKYTRIRLRMPKVKVSMQTELSPALKQVGVHEVFTDDADLSGISPKPLAVSAVLHESVLKLDEQGLEGAAATAVLMRAAGMIIDTPRSVDIDRPFLLLVRHEKTGVTYFMARVVTPG